MATRIDKGTGDRVRFAVVGLGHFAQSAVLPAFAHASEDCELAALVSSDPRKLEELAERHGAPETCDYDGYDELLASGRIDAVYVATPNALHKDFTLRALAAGVHVLCEKPLAPTSAECEEMIAAAEASGALLMTAYRLHFEEGTLETARLVRGGGLGEVRYFSSEFSFQVKDENIRVRGDMGGGPLGDIGVYCINAARTFFDAEPHEAFAFEATPSDDRFAEVGATYACILRFPGDRLAQFTVSFAAADVSRLRVVGTEGDVTLEPAYAYAEALNQRVTKGDDVSERTFDKRDQIAPELVHFAHCIRTGERPEPAGEEGLADVRVVEALLESVRTGAPVALTEFTRARHADPANEMSKPPQRKPETVNVDSPHYN